MGTVESEFWIRRKLSPVDSRVNNTTLEPAKGGFQFRSGIKFNEQVSGAGFMTMRPEYPVFVCKMSIPRQSEAAQPGNSNTWISFRWNNPYTGKVNDPMPNDGGGGFWGFKGEVGCGEIPLPMEQRCLGARFIYLYNAARGRLHIVHPYQ